MQLPKYAQRLLLCGLLLVVACDKKEAPPIGGSAGSVLLVDGEVSAARPGETMRELKEGATVYADDTLHTGPNGRLDLLLTHNGARYEVGADRDFRLDESVAWRATLQSDSVFDPAQLKDTAAGGTGSEREAAHSAGVAVAEAKQDPAGKLAKDVNLQDAEDGDERRDEGMRPREDGSSGSPGTLGLVGAGGGGTGAGAGTGKGRAGTGASESDKGESTDGGRAAVPDRQGHENQGAKNEDEGGKVPEAGDAATTRDASNETQTLDSAQVQLLFVYERARICQKAGGGSGAFRITIGAKDRHVTEMVTIGPKALTATLECLKKELRAATLPNSEPVSVTLELKPL